MALDYISDRMFILSDEQKTDIEKLQYYDFYFHLVRHDFIDAPLIKACVMDYWTIFYYKEIPVINSGNALIFLLRDYLVESLIKQPKLFRLKKTTVGSFSKSMFAAAATLNVYLDFLRDVLGAMPQKDVDFFWKHAKNTKSLFRDDAIDSEAYPKKLVRIETFMLKDLRRLIEQNPEQFTEKMQKVIRLVDQLNLIEKDIFGSK